jgi:hypothetical protein
VIMSSLTINLPSAHVVDTVVSHTVGFKLNVVEYAKEHSNRGGERHFGPPSAKKICE